MIKQLKKRKRNTGTNAGSGWRDSGTPSSSLLISQPFFSSYESLGHFGGRNGTGTS
jgi:hypothetical protein